MLMLVVAYTINDTLVGNYSAENVDGLGCNGIIIIFITAVFTIGNVVFAIFQYIWFSGCSTNVVIMTITVISSVASYVVVFFRTREDASILTSSVVSAYLFYLQWSALASRDNK
jgi:Serine incorporator (Serinc)